MPYNVFLHRSFDYQLFSSPSCILDWAPIRMIVRTTSALNGSNKYEPLLSSTDEETWQMSVTELNFKLNAERNWVQSEWKKAQELTNIKNSEEETKEINSSGNDDSMANINTNETYSPRQVDNTATQVFREANATPSSIINNEFELGREDKESGVDSCDVRSYTRNKNMMNDTASAHLHEPDAFHVHESENNTNTYTGNINSIIGNENNVDEEIHPTKSISTINTELVQDKYDKEPDNSFPVLEATQHNRNQFNNDATNANENVNQSTNTVTNGVNSVSNVKSGINTKEDHKNVVMTNNILPFVSDGELLSNLIPPRKRWSGEIICQSYGRVPLYKRHSFVILASLYPSIGLSCTKQYERSENMSEIAEGLHFLSENCTKIGMNRLNEKANSVQGADSTNHISNKHEKQQFTNSGIVHSSRQYKEKIKRDNTHHQNGKKYKKEKFQVNNMEQVQSKTNTYADNRCDDQYINIGQLRTTHSVRSSQILQLEWFYDQLKWRGVCNVRLKPSSLYSPTCPYWHLPCCEYVMQTPWTEWSVQCDEEVLKWSGFLTLYKSHVLSSSSPLEVSETQSEKLLDSTQLSNNKKETVKTNANTDNGDAESHILAPETEGEVVKVQTPKLITNTLESKTKKNHATSQQSKTNVNKANEQNTNTSNLSTIELQQDKESTANQANAAFREKASNKKERTITTKEKDKLNKDENDIMLAQNMSTQSFTSKSNIAKPTASFSVNETKHHSKTVTPTPSTKITKQENNSANVASRNPAKESSKKVNDQAKEDKELQTNTAVTSKGHTNSKINVVKSKAELKEEKQNLNEETSTEEIIHSNEKPTRNQQNKTKYTLYDEPFPRLPHHHWWRLRHLKVGSGLACKRDFKSGMNLYCGFSGECGHGLGFAAHIDVLRRLCCSLTSTTSCPSFPLPSLMHLPSSTIESKTINSSTHKETTKNNLEIVDDEINNNDKMLTKHNGRLDMAVRLKVNLITFHSTTLEGGLCYYPFPTLYPHLSLRWSYSPHTDSLTPSLPVSNTLITNKMFVLEEPISSTSVFGLHIPDVTHELFSDWISQHRKARDERRLEEQWKQQKEKQNTEEQQKKEMEEHEVSVKGKLRNQNVQKPNSIVQDHHTIDKENKENNNKINSSNTSLHEVSGTWFSFGWFPGMVGGWLWSIPTLLSKTATSTTSPSAESNDKSNCNGSDSVTSSQADELHLTDSNSNNNNNHNNLTKSNVASSQLILHTNKLVDTHFPFFHYTALVHSFSNAQRIMLLKCMHLWQTCIRVYRIIKHQIHHSWRYTKSLDWLEAALDGCHVDVSVGVNVYHHRINYTHPYKLLPSLFSSSLPSQHHFQTNNDNNITVSNNVGQNKPVAFPHIILSQRDRRSWNSFVILSAH